MHFFVRSLRARAVLAAVCFALTQCGSEHAASEASASPDAGLTTTVPSADAGHTTRDAGSEELPPPLRKANVVFILTDDLSWNLVKYMPNVLKMQQQGVTFSNFFVASSLCCPSRASIFTGKYPHDTGVYENAGSDGGYDTFKAKGNGAVSFPAALKVNGYATAMMGKFMNGYEPSMPVATGWSEWAVAGFGYKNFDYDLNQNGSAVHYGATRADYLTDVIAARGVDFVKKNAAGPFLIEIAPFTPHSPFTPAPRDEDLFPGLKAPRAAAFGARPGATAPEWLKSIPPMTAEDEAEIDDKFKKRAQAVQAIDRMIGELQAAVAAAGKTSETYFVFSSDNGFHLGEHSLRGGKRTAFDTDIHVPLIVTGPGVPAGRVVDAVTESIDLCATFTELGQTQKPTGSEGRSLVPFLRGATPLDWRDVAYVEQRGSQATPSDPDAATPGSGDPPSYEALRTKDRLYVEYATGEVEYHAETDPDELTNSVASLPIAMRTKLHTALLAVKGCHDEASCWAAQHLGP